MILASTSSTAPRPAPERVASAAMSASGVADADPSDPLAQLEDFVESAARSRKAFAEDRLKFLGEQMTKLSLFNLAPGFLVDHTARMARELESAAGDFAGSVRTLAGTEQDSGAAAPSQLPQSYLDILDGSIGSGSVKLSSEDEETAVRFMNTAEQLRFIAELAASDQDGRADIWGSADSARDATARVTGIMLGLEGPGAFVRTFG
ncbi:hypothetical protein DFR52_104529 [Hoeflea marina]|uniref:Uncharacterized protein n=1 Tax=Hoeflea marina TaxID=274592 RepID=A0A317PH23_9HYPH|nr:hypothetical protein [Hoeflea marina]PWV99236.1 hypothetical protein DFR52_104529 [Hoeflea marina]